MTKAATIDTTPGVPPTVVYQPEAPSLFTSGRLAAQKQSGVLGAASGRYSGARHGERGALAMVHALADDFAAD